VFERIVNRFLFRPVLHTHDWVEPPVGLPVEDVGLTGADGRRLHAWWTTPDGWHPSQGALLYCHGNAGNLSHRGEGVRRWRDLMGQAVLIFDYPGYGRSEGQPCETGCYASGDAAYDYLVAVQKVPPERILLYGGSLGAAVAIDLASRRPHRALVLVSGFTSLRDMARRLYPWLPIRWFLPSCFDNLAKIARCSGPVFIAHGTADHLVPFEQGERLFAAAREPKAFFPMAGYDHNHSPGPDFYVALREFLAQTNMASSPTHPAVK
jgi:fermentation-respiration switch protein FrsA (DUF1100 family)